jgi:hypothetical protein
VPAAFAGRRWLPDQTIFDLSFEYILGSFERPVMAHVMAWDSEAPIHGRPGIGERVQGELPPIKRKAKFSEKEIIRFLTPRAGTPDVQTAVNSVYDLTRVLLDSVQARVEWLRMQALSEDTVVYDEGGAVFEFDYGMTDEFQIDLTTQTDGAGASVAADVSTVWSDTANANGILDLQYACDTIEDTTGFRPVEFVCSRKALGYLLRQDAVRDMVRGSAAPNVVLTQPELQTLLSLYNLPNIVTYDVKVRSENADGSYSDVRTMAENKSFLVPPSTATLGTTLWGPTAESRPLIGTNLAAQAPGIFAVTYGVEEPPSEWVKAVGVSFPSIPGANLLGQMTLFA